MPQGTPEELRNTWERSEEYLYRILSYAPRDREKDLTKEELEEERRYLKFLRLGPRAGYLRHAPKTKLTSADVLYILTCTLPSKFLCQVYDVSKETINGIRRNHFVEWSWEYYFVKRIKTLVRSEIYKYGGYGVEENAYIRFYKLEQLQPDNSFKVIAYMTGIRKAQRLREGLISKKEFTKLTKEGTLDIVWPITKIDVM